MRDLRTMLDLAVIAVGVPLIALAQAPQTCGDAPCPPAAITVVPTPKIVTPPPIPPVPQVLKTTPLPAPTNLVETKCVNGAQYKKVNDKWEPMLDTTGKFILCKQ